MQQKLLVKAGLLTIILVIVFFTIWEIYLRSQEYKLFYDDNESLWASKRKLVYDVKNTTTVFIGSSRIKYDLDIPTWNKLSGTKAVQLALVGSSPRPVLDNLANDPNFKGNLIIDVTEGLFFSVSPRNVESPIRNIEYFKKLTPAQQFSSVVNNVLESKFVFLDKDFLSLNALINKIPIRERQGFYAGPDFPREFHGNTSERQSIMSDKFITDTLLQNKVKNIWEMIGKASKSPPISGTKLDSILGTVKLDCDKIKLRGGSVVFIRTPSSGQFLIKENMGYPRKQYWDRMLQMTSCKGIHFADFQSINHFECPEFSHLSHPDAIIYTKELIKLITDTNLFAIK